MTKVFICSYTFTTSGCEVRRKFHDQVPGYCGLHRTQCYPTARRIVAKFRQMERVELLEMTVKKKRVFTKEILHE